MEQEVEASREEGEEGEEDTGGEVVQAEGAIPGGRVADTEVRGCAKPNCHRSRSCTTWTTVSKNALCKIYLPQV